MTRTPDRQAATLLIEAAVTAGARRAKACTVSEISERTLRRWTRGGQVHADQRPLVQRPEPRNKLSEDERATVLSICNSNEFANLPPSQIVPKLADQGVYLASESSFYRMSRARRGSSITAAGQGRPSSESRRPVTGHRAHARSGPGTSPGCRGQSRACSSTSI